MTSLGRNIRVLRLAKGLTQTELAVQLGVGMMDISRWERNAVYPSGPAITRLVQFFGCEVLDNVTEGATK